MEKTMNTIILQIKSNQIASTCSNEISCFYSPLTTSTKFLKNSKLQSNRQINIIAPEIRLKIPPMQFLVG